MNITPKTIVFTLLFAAFLPAFAQLSLEEIFLKGNFYPRPVDDMVFLHKSDQYAVLRNSSKGKQIVFYNSMAKAVDSIEAARYDMDGVLLLPKYEGLKISRSDQYFLLEAEEEKIYRRSSAANYFLMQRSGQASWIGGAKLSFPNFSFDDKKLAYVKYNNLYWYDIASKTEHAVTTDGKWNFIINGKSDWVYEEELELTQAYAWNWASDKIAYLKFDETEVKEYTVPQYYNLVYPVQYTYKYPKAGERNSTVSLWIYDLKKNKNMQVDLRAYPYEYITRMGWNSTGNEVWAELLNRHQDSITVVAYDISTKKSRVIYEDHSGTYLDVPLTFDFLNDNSFITTSRRDGYNHLYWFDANGKLIRQLTKGNFEVTAYYGGDIKHKKIFYQSNEGYTAGKKVFSLNYETLQKEMLTPGQGVNSIAFAPGFHYYFLSNSSASSPYTLKIFSNEGKDSVLIEDNAALREKFSIYPQKEFIKIPVNGAELEAWIIKPDSFDVSKKYPLFMYVYGGPGNQEVVDKWGSTIDIWFSYLARQGYVVACVDNRGSGGKDAAFENCIYKQLGKLETEDQIAAAKYFVRSYCIDSSRIGIWGSSYGGYMAASCLFNGADVFKTAIAELAVSDWRLYDNIYTERYMRTPTENPKGYSQSSLLNSARKLKGNLLLIHGTADDNVHFQHTIQLINALNDAHKTYGLYIYPDKRHGISGGETRYDLFDKITQFLLDKL